MAIKGSFLGAAKLQDAAPARARGRAGSETRPERSPQRKGLVAPNDLRDPVRRARSTRIAAPSLEAAPVAPRRRRWNLDYL